MRFYLITCHSVATIFQTALSIVKGETPDKRRIIILIFRFLRIVEILEAKFNSGWEGYFTEVILGTYSPRILNMMHWSPHFVTFHSGTWGAEKRRFNCA